MNQPLSPDHVKQCKTTEAIESFKKDLGKFVNTFFGVEIQPWQIEVIQNLKDAAERKLEFRFKLPKEKAAKLNGIDHPFIIVDEEVPEELHENHHPTISLSSASSVPSNTRPVRAVVTDDPGSEGRDQ